MRGRLAAGRYTDEQNEDLRSLFPRGCCGFLVFVVASGCFTRLGKSGRRGGLGRFDLGRHSSTTKNHVFSGGRGSPIRLASSARPLATSRAAARGRKRGTRLAVCSSPVRAVRDVRARLDMSCFMSASSVIGVAAAPRCGFLHAPESSRASGWRGAHSSDGITPGCTRRRRARFSQPARGEPV